MPNNINAMPNNNRVMPNNTITIILAGMAPHKKEAGNSRVFQVIGKYT